MQHFHAVKRLHPFGDLLDDAAHGFQCGFWVVDHPLRQRLACDKLGDDIQKIPFARLQAGLQHMRAVDTPRDPLFHQKAFQIRRVALQVDGRRFDHDGAIGFLIQRQIHVAAAAGMHLANDFVTVEQRSCVEYRRKRQLGELLIDFIRSTRGQFVDAHNLYGEVVAALAPVGLGDDQFSRCIQIAGLFAHRVDDEFRRRISINPIGHQDKNIALFHRQRLVINFKLRLHTQRARKIGGVLGHTDLMIVGELFQCVITQAINTRITDMKNMRGGGFDHQRT